MAATNVVLIIRRTMVFDHRLFNEIAPIFGNDIAMLITEGDYKPKAASRSTLAAWGRGYDPRQRYGTNPMYWPDDLFNVQRLVAECRKQRVPKRALLRWATTTPAIRGDLMARVVQIIHMGY